MQIALPHHVEASWADHWRLLYSGTIAGGSTLLFLVQPILAKAILPRFGGSAAVWVTCMLFFQVVLLLGYLYSYAITRYFHRRAQTAIHLALLGASLAALPLKLARTGASGNPVPSILLLLALSVGLPYFLLSTNSPLMQSWYATQAGARFPYRLFAVSNAASLAALLAYPLGIERIFSGNEQVRYWSAAYFVWVLVAAATALRHRYGGVRARIGGAGARPLVWIALAACASALWLAIANHLSQEVAPIPFVWVLPLSLYLLSFVLCFDRDRWYRPSLFRWLLPAAWVAICARIALQGSMGGLKWEISVLAAALFICCMFCHGELARMKPEPQWGLAFYCLMIALGGALGGVFVGLIAPALFRSYLELPISIIACVLLGMWLLYGASYKRLIRMGVVAAAAFFFATRFSAGGTDVVRLRNFFGVLQVSDSGTGEEAVRTLYNGRTIHGREYLSPARSRMATTFYGPESGAGQVLQAVRTAERHVGVIGLGVGTLATYGRRGDHFRFYEINPAVVEVASRYFHFLQRSEAATDVVTGDGRLGLEREPAKSFDVIILDAFSDDAIPVHLLTREAFEAYFRHLRDGGVLAVHVTNRYLELGAVVEAAGAALHKQISLIHNRSDAGRQILMADWAVLADNRESLDKLMLPQERAIARRVRLWTDDYSDLLQVMR